MGKRAPQRKRLTPKQKKLVNAVLRDPHASLSELGRSSDYDNAANVARALKAPAVVDALERFRGEMEQRPKLANGKILDRLEEGLEATDVRSLKVDGSKFKVSAEVKDFSVRHKYLETVLELKGVTKQKADAAPTGPVNVAIILMGGGSEAEKTAVADALLAARISRGLHPSLNRLMTEDEAATYRRTL